MRGLFADGVGTPVDQGVSTFLFIGAVLFGSVAVARWRRRAIQASPGTYRLTAEFVAVDHAPFDPRVVAGVRFRVVP